VRGTTGVAAFCSSASGFLGCSEVLFPFAGLLSSGFLSPAIEISLRKKMLISMKKLH